MTSSSHSRLLTITLAVLVQFFLLPGSAGLSCILQRIAGDDCCCALDESTLLAEDSCCSASRDAIPHSADQGPQANKDQASGNNAPCSCEVEPADSTTPPRESLVGSAPTAHALPVDRATRTAAPWQRRSIHFDREAPPPQASPPIYLLDQVFLI